MRRAAVKVVQVIAALAFVVSLGVAALYVHARRSLPQTSGAVTVSGIAAPVDIIRDGDGVPHIYAATRPDALFGLGYVHAQDRLWQMEFQRRIGHGRLSEIFGPQTIPQDRFLRTVGFGRAARAAWDTLAADARTLVDAYVAGVNAFIEAHHGGRLPPEFVLLRFEPEPWTPVDVMVWAKMMAWDLSANYSFELMRHDIAARVGPERMAELLPPYPAHGPSIVGASRDAAVARRRERPDPVPAAPQPAASGAMRGGLSRAFARGLSEGHPAVREFLLRGPAKEGLGSNSWVVDGTLTATGRPMLANDPHLGAGMPSLWYLAHLSAGDFDVIGATLPGAPAVAIGRNRFIAWGETNVAADVEDLYRERLDATGTRAEYQGVFEPLTVISETIGVSGADPVRVEVRISRHGPIISDAINANNAETKGPAGALPEPLEPLALRWTALEEQDSTIAAFLRLNEARDWAEFTAALRDYVVPAQNFVYADTAGHIGYSAPGRIPIRASGDGSMPAEGWTGTMEWTGWVPFDELPHVYDPPEHVIVSANHRPAPASYPHLISLEFPEPFRAMRIRELLADRRGLTVDDMRAIQADTVSLAARSLLPLMLQHADPRGTANYQAMELARRWDGDARGESAAAAIFQAWFLQLAPAIAGDELGERALDAYNGRFSYIARFVANQLGAKESPWCDDQRTPERETCQAAVTRALADAIAVLSGRMGRDLGTWRWDVIHPVMFPHQGLDSVSLLRPWLSRSVPGSGDWSTVNVGAPDADAPFEQREVSGYRQIVDLSPANDSRFLDAVGQSGHPLSNRYDDFLEDWRAVRHRPMRMDRAAIERDAIGTLRLRRDDE